MVERHVHAVDSEQGMFYSEQCLLCAQCVVQVRHDC